MADVSGIGSFSSGGDYFKSLNNNSKTSSTVNQVVSTVNNVTKEVMSFDDVLNEPKQTVQITVEEYFNQLKAMGFTDAHIERIKNGEKVEDIYTELLKDDKFRENLYKNSYVKNIEFKESIKIENFEQFENLIEELSGKQKELEDKISKLKVDNEEEAINKIYEGLKEGKSLEDILRENNVWQYVDEKGVTRYVYSEPDSTDGTVYKVVGLDTVCKNAGIYDELYSFLSKEDRNFFFSKSEVHVLNDSDISKLENWKKNYDLKKKEKKSEIEAIEKELITVRSKNVEYTHIKNEIEETVKHQINNVDAYTQKEDFLKNNNFNSKYTDYLNKIRKNAEEGAYKADPNTGTVHMPINNEDDMISVIACMINNKGGMDNKGNTIFAGDNVIEFESNDKVFNEYVKYAKHMNEEEVSIFNYILNTEGTSKAKEYLKNIAEMMDKRWLSVKTKEDQEFAKENPLLVSAASIILTPFEGISAACYSMNSVITGEKIRRADVYSSGDIWRAQVSKDINEYWVSKGNADLGSFLSFAYNTGMSMADSVSLIGVSTLTGGAAVPALSATLMGSRAYVSTLNDALDRGLSDKQAVALAFSSAVVETAMESYSVGHLMNLEGKLGENLLKITNKISSSIPNKTAAKIASKSFYVCAGAVSQGLAEGEEEFATEILNYVADIFIAKESSNYAQSIQKYLEAGYSEDEAGLAVFKDLMWQAGQAFVGGFASGICFGTFGSIKTTINTSQAIANNMYTDLKGKTSAQQFAEALEINRQQLEMAEKASKQRQEQANKTVENVESLAKLEQEISKFDETLISIFKSREEGHAISIPQEYVETYKRVVGLQRQVEELTGKKFSLVEQINKNLKTIINADAIDDCKYLLEREINNFDDTLIGIFKNREEGHAISIPQEYMETYKKVVGLQSELESLSGEKFSFIEQINKNLESHKHKSKIKTANQNDSNNWGSDYVRRKIVEANKSAIYGDGDFFRIRLDSWSDITEEGFSNIIDRNNVALIVDGKVYSWDDAVSKYTQEMNREKIDNIINNNLEQIKNVESKNIDINNKIETYINKQFNKSLEEIFETSSGVLEFLQELNSVESDFAVGENPSEFMESVAKYIIESGLIEKLDLSNSEGLNSMFHLSKLKEFCNELLKTNKFYDYIAEAFKKKASLAINTLKNHDIGEASWNKILESEQVDKVLKNFSNEDIISLINTCNIPELINNNYVFNKILNFEFSEFQKIDNLSVKIEKVESANLIYEKILELGKNTQEYRESSLYKTIEQKHNKELVKKIGEKLGKVENHSYYEVYYIIDGKEYTKNIRSDGEVFDVSTYWYGEELEKILNGEIIIDRLEISKRDKFVLKESNGISDGINKITYRINGQETTVFKENSFGYIDLSYTFDWENVDNFEILNIEKANFDIPDTNIETNLKNIKITYESNGKERTAYIKKGFGTIDLNNNILDFFGKYNVKNPTNLKLSAISDSEIENIKSQLNEKFEKTSFYDRLYNKDKYGGNQSDVEDIISEGFKNEGSLSESDLKKFELFKDLAKNYFPGVDDAGIINLASHYASGGCSYMAIANLFINHMGNYDGAESIFREKMGYDMYFEETNGNLNFNNDVLAFEMYLNRFSKEYNLDNMDEMLKRGSGVSSVLAAEVYETYFKDKGIDCKLTYDNSEDNLDDYIMNIYRTDGKSNFVMSSDEFSLDIVNGGQMLENMTDEAMKRANIENGIIKDIGGHAMAITDVDSVGNIKVSSWSMDCNFSNENFGNSKMNMLWKVDFNVN